MNLIDQIEVEHHFAEGMYLKQMHVKAGLRIATHKHVYDHISYLIGEAEVTVDGVKTLHVGPKAILIEAGKHHGIRAVTNIVWICIHATSETEVSNVDRVLTLPSAAEDMRKLAESL